MGILRAIFSSQSRAAIARTKRENISGDLKGDGLQNGGALVVEAGGKLLYNFKQEDPAQHVPNKKFLEVLGLPVEEVNGEAGESSGAKAEPQAECSEVCSMPPKK